MSVFMFLLTCAGCAVNVYFAIVGHQQAVNAAVAVFCALSAAWQIALMGRHL